MRNSVLTVLAALLLIFPLSVITHSWDFAKDQVSPEYMLNRPNETYPVDQFNDDVFTRENFYNRHAGHRQEKRYQETPDKSLTFKVYKPSEEPATKTKIVEKDGRAVTEISIDKDSVSTTDSE